MIGLGETWLDYIVDLTTGGCESAYVDIVEYKKRRMTEPLPMSLSHRDEVVLVHSIAEWRKERGDAEGYQLAMARLHDLLGDATEK